MFMKTFKAVRFQIVNDEQITEYELLDGIIINKENSGTGWLLEILMSDIHYALFQSRDSHLHPNVLLYPVPAS